MAADRGPIMEKEAADWRAWYLTVIEQGEHRDERIEAVLWQTIDEYQASVSKSTISKASWENAKKRKGGQ
jgi:hypothetical protein